MLKYALWYLQQGYSVIPILPSMEKKPLIAWKEYQKRLPTEKEVKAWWREHPIANVGVVTGKVSGLLVIDLDTPDAVNFFNSKLPMDFTPLHYLETPRGGYHYWFRYPKGVKITNSASDIFQGFDIRGEGGYVVAPASKIALPDEKYQKKYVGRVYTWQGDPPLKKDLQDLPKELLDLIIEKNKSDPSANIKTDASLKYLKFTDELKIPEGTRDEALFHIANNLVKAQIPLEEVFQILLSIAMNCCEPPFPKKEAVDKVKSALKRVEEYNSTYMDEVKNFIDNNSGIITTTELYRHLNVHSRRAKKAIVKCLLRLEKKGLVKKTGRRAGEYIIVNENVKFVDWKNTELTTVKFWLPLGMDKAIDVIPGSIIAIAGMQNAGKTAWAMNIAYHNQLNFKTIYFSSETTPEEFKERAARYTDIDSWSVEFGQVEDMYNIEGAIQPDALNIIDYLEPPGGDYTLMAQKMADIHRKLNKGIAVVCLQKKAEGYGAGGEYMKNKPHLYITLDVLFKKGISKATILKCKKPKYGFKNPQGLEAKYRVSLCNGVAIEEIEPFRFERWLKEDNYENY